ncbi:MAG: tRNA (adenine-N1)-methyltransferase [Acidimicrobiia bacterium]
MDAPIDGAPIDDDPIDAATSSGPPFAVGERVLLVDAKARRYLVTLAADGSFQSHAGVLAHTALLGEQEGVRVRTSRGAGLTAVRPTLAEYVLEMPRGAQIIYPKDLGPILMLADPYPGARVFEAGVGSGALTMALLRAVGPTGSVLGYEIRPDFASRAQRNVEAFLGPDQPLVVELRDVYEGIDARNLDRMVLDLPEPWRIVKHAEEALRPGGIFFAYLPTIGQVARLREELAESSFGLAETLEVLQRSWHVAGPSVRPDHRMVAHTGFLTCARLLSRNGSSGPTRAQNPTGAVEGSEDPG